MGVEEARFETAPDTELKCVLCLGVLLNPMQTPCEHYFCSGCIPNQMPACPVCRRPTPPNTFTPAPRIVRNIINNLRVHCKYRGKGCADVVALEVLPTHERECPYGVVVCDHSGCEQEVDRRNLSQHQAACPYRMVLCPNGCGATRAHSQVSCHETLCTHSPIPCLLCGQTILRGQAQEHHTNHCPRAQCPCPIPGCEFMALRGDGDEWESHEANSSNLHISLLASALGSTRDVIARMELMIERQSDRIEELQNQVRQQSPRTGTQPAPPRRVSNSRTTTTSTNTDEQAGPESRSTVGPHIVMDFNFQQFEPPPPRLPSTPRPSRRTPPPLSRTSLRRSSLQRASTPQLSHTPNFDIPSESTDAPAPSTFAMSRARSSHSTALANIRRALDSLDSLRSLTAHSPTPHSPLPLADSPTEPPPAAASQPERSAIRRHVAAEAALERSRDRANYLRALRLERDSEQRHAGWRQRVGGEELLRESRVRAQRELSRWQARERATHQQASPPSGESAVTASTRESLGSGVGGSGRQSDTSGNTAARGESVGAATDTPPLSEQTWLSVDSLFEEPEPAHSNGE